MNGKCIKKGSNKAGTVFALVEYYDDNKTPEALDCYDYDKTFAVFKLCSNYDGNVKGGIRKEWRVVKKGNYSEMIDLYNKRLLGTQK